MSLAANRVTDAFVFLTGRPPAAEFLAFVIGESVAGQNLDRRALMDEWRRANDRVRELEAAEAGLADHPERFALPEMTAPWVPSVIGSDSFRRQTLAYATIATIDLDRLVMFQKQINLRYVADLRALLGSQPSDLDVFKFCFNIDMPTSGVTVDAIGYSFIFRSQSMDLRMLQPIVLQPDQVTADFNGMPVAVLAFPVGFGDNLLSAIAIEDRLLLHNGSHRAYALREAGITHAPCVIVEARREELPILLGVEEVVNNPDRYLHDPRPPLLKDFFDPALRKVVDLYRRQRQIKLAFGSEQSSPPI